MTVPDVLRYELVKKLLEEAGLWTSDLRASLDEATFRDQEDGGMGSFSVVNGKQARTGARDCAEAKYIDADGVEVIIALIVDELGRPTDVDFWKVNSTPLVKFPISSELAIRKK